MKKQVVKVLAVSVFLSLSSLNINAGIFGGDWMGWVYPDADDLTVYKHIGQFDSLSECRQAAQNALNSLATSNGGDYECGYMCKKSDKYDDLHVCKETRR